MSNRYALKNVISSNKINDSWNFQSFSYVYAPKLIRFTWKITWLKHALRYLSLKLRIIHLQTLTQPISTRVRRQTPCWPAQLPLLKWTLDSHRFRQFRYRHPSLRPWCLRRQNRKQPGLNVINFFPLSISIGQNKLEYSTVCHSQSF